MTKNDFFINKRACKLHSLYYYYYYYKNEKN